jgi:glycosyltransferase involved in cell wall biosynthesis
MREIAARRQADVVETHAVKSHFLTRFAGLHKRCHWVAFQHGYTAEDLKMRLYIKLDRWSLRAANRVATDCTAFAGALEQIGVNPQRIEVLPSSIQPAPRPDPELVRGLRQRLGIPESARVILSIGRLSAEKAHADLIAALRILMQEGPNTDIRLVLVGDGIERRNLETVVASSGLTREVIFAGQQRDIWPYYGLADLFVLPSLSEGSPNVLLEAMSAGVPIVATSVGGVPETVENESTALLVPSRDPASLAAACRRILSDTALAARLAANGSIRVVDRFSPQSYCDRLCRIYRTAMETPLG